MAVIMLKPSRELNSCRKAELACISMANRRRVRLIVAASLLLSSITKNHPGDSTDVNSFPAGDAPAEPLAAVFFASVWAIWSYHALMFMSNK